MSQLNTKAKEVLEALERIEFLRKHGTYEELRTYIIPFIAERIYIETDAADIYVPYKSKSSILVENGLKKRVDIADDLDTWKTIFPVIKYENKIAVFVFDWRKQYKFIQTPTIITKSMINRLNKTEVDIFMEAWKNLFSEK